MAWNHDPGEVLIPPVRRDGPKVVSLLHSLGGPVLYVVVQPVMRLHQVPWRAWSLVWAVLGRCERQSAR